jgi:broad specificity phosphatase PhoE
MREFRYWVLQPLLTAVFVIVLSGLIYAFYAFLPWRDPLTALRGHLVEKRPYDRNLSNDLLAELRNGGFTLFVRHGKSDGGNAAIDRASLLKIVPSEYQRSVCLNEQGRAESQILGQFFSAKKIPIGEVVASPVCRARETAELSLGRVDRLDPSLIFPDLLAPDERHAAQMSVKKLLEQTPAAGTNRMLVSHGAVLESIGYESASPEQAGMVIFQHTGKGPTIRSIVTLYNMTLALPAGP